MNIYFRALLEAGGRPLPEFVRFLVIFFIITITIFISPSQSYLQNVDLGGLPLQLHFIHCIIYNLTLKAVLGGEDDKG